jgi:nucleoside-diphosphate-sugar epimerase
MKVLITGATGFIGKSFATRLAKEGHKVIACGRNFKKLGHLINKVRISYFDINDKDSILSALRKDKPDIVCHSAALVESINLPKLLKINKDGTENVFSACFEENIKDVIYVSSIAVISGNDEVPLTEDLPFKATNFYGKSKIEAEKIALKYREKGMNVAIIRPCMVYGVSEPHGLNRLIKALKLRMIPIFKSGNNKIQLVSVENVVDVMMLCLTNKNAYEGSFFVADKEILTMKELFSYISSIIGAKPPFNAPDGISNILYKIPFTKKIVSFFMKDRIYSIERLKEKLNYVPRVSTYDGLKEAIFSYKKLRR